MIEVKRFLELWKGYAKIGGDTVICLYANSGPCRTI